VITLVNSDLQRIHGGVVDRVEGETDRAERLDRAAGLYDTWSRRRKIDIRARRSAGIVLMDIVLTYIADANIEALWKLMLDREVVLLRVRPDRRVLGGHRRIGAESAGAGKGRVHGECGNRRTRLGIGLRRSERKTAKRRAVDVLRREKIVEDPSRAAHN